MSALPKAVREQAERAEQLAKELKASQSGEAPDPEQSQQEGQQPPKEGGDPASAAEHRGQPEPQDSSTPAESPAAPQTPQSAPEDDRWEQRFRVLKGKYDAEVPRLHAAVRAKDQQLGELHQRLNDMEARMEAMNARGPKQGGIEEHPEIDEEEIKQFGPDLYDFIQRAARKVADDIVRSREDRLTGQLNEVKQSTSQMRESMAKSEREKLIEYMNEHVSNWLEVNEDPKFIEWLDQYDPYAGEVRGKLLKQAFERNEAVRVANFFKGFLNENAAVKQTQDSGSTAPQGQEGGHPPAEGQQEPQAKLDDYMAPGTPKTGPDGAQEGSGKRVWTRGEIRDFQNRKNEFVRKGRPIPEEYEKLERDLFKAQQEGRIRD